MKGDKLGADGLKGGPDGGIEKLDEEDLPVDQGELEHPTPVKLFARLELLKVLCGQDPALMAQVTDYEGIDDVHHDRKAAKDERKPKGPDPIPRADRDRVRDQGAQEGGQATDGKLQTDGDRQMLGAKPLGQDGFLHRHNQSGSDPKDHSAGDHQAKGLVLGRNRRQQTAHDHHTVHRQCSPDRAKHVDKDAAKDGENGGDDGHRRWNHTVLGIVDVKILVWKKEKKKNYSLKHRPLCFFFTVLIWDFMALRALVEKWEPTVMKRLGECLIVKVIFYTWKT